jgi:sugar (pentulose or hexulose) kinase
VRQVLLGIDVGTSFCKAVVVDADGAQLALGRARTPWTAVPTGAEADPRALVRAALAAAAQAVAGVPGAEVIGVGIAGIAETGVLLDSGGDPLAPAPAWHDARGESEAADLAAALGADAFAVRTGLPVSSLCTLSKLRWQRSSLPAAGRAVRWLGVPEWVGRALGAADVAELSLASRTGMLSLDTAAWWPDALAWLGVGDAFMAEPVAAGTSVGRVGDALPAARGATITIAGHDHVVAMVGAGATGEGDVLHSVGTADVFVRTVPAHLDPARVADAVAERVTVGWHVMPERWALLSGGERSVALTAVLQRLGIDGQAARDALTEAAAGIGSGEGTTPAHVWRDALAAGAEMSAATLAHSDAVGGPRRRIVATGGGVRGTAERAAREQRLGPIEWSPVGEATARGAALLAGVAAGIYASAAEAPGVPAAVCSAS